MKPFASAVVGAALIGGTSMVLPLVAFAAEIHGRSSASAADAKHSGREAVEQDGAQTTACVASQHAHAGSCTCARCASAQRE